MSGGERADVAVQPVFSREDIEGFGDLFNDRPASPPPAGIGGLVKLTASRLAEKRFHFPGAIGMDGPNQPVEKQILDLIRQSQQNPCSAYSAGFRDGLEDLGQLHIGQPGNDGRDVHRHRHPGRR